MAPTGSSEDDEDGGGYYVEDMNQFSLMDYNSSSRLEQPVPDEVPTCVVCIDMLGMHGGPASLPCGHNGCLECLRKVQSHSTCPLCPLCRTPFDPDMALRPNLELKAALEQAAARRTSANQRVVKTASAMEDWPDLPSSAYDTRKQLPPELTVRNVVKGLLAIVSKGVRPRHAQAAAPPQANWANQTWNSVTLPSAPPFFTGTGDDVLAAKAVLEAEPPEWLPDSSSFVCMQCSTSFRPLTCGRHHCRFCGGLFCRACSRGRCLMPIRFRQREPQRVCDACYEKLEPVQRIVAERVSNASQRATHDVTDLSCMRSWVNSPLSLSMEQEIYKATNTIRSYEQVGSLSPEHGIPDAVLRGAVGVAIITVAKVGVMFTYKLGTGIVLARNCNGTWSGPSAIATAGVGWGVQAGTEVADLLIVLRTQEAVKAFGGRLHFSFGAELSCAAGPVGRHAEADVRAGDGGTAACFTYSLTKGMFIGVSLEGSVVMRRGDTNLRFYGDPYMTSMDILSGVCPPPIAAAPLYQALDELFHRDWDG